MDVLSLRCEVNALVVFYIQYMGSNKRNKILDIKIHSR